jgi:hypothetical protein
VLLVHFNTKKKLRRIACLVIDHGVIRSDILRWARTESRTCGTTLQNFIQMYDQKRRKNKMFLRIIQEILGSMLKEMQLE